ncbi:carbohydrate kinase family protein [Pseudactinotalea sp. Z1732]|uniref:carbohydrate kinase family protein n=1 Tax=Pseudactinotalea sp. Z1732 TaxID=3413026 RepID=UPI003C7D053E
MTAAPGALVVGEALVDVVRDAGGHVTEHPGGSPANVAIGLSRLGRPVRLSTWFGSDAHGDLVRAHLTGAGVDLTRGSDGAERTSTALARLDSDGAAQYTFDLEWRVPATTVDEHVRVLHAGSIAATLPPGADEVARLLNGGATHATISYDPNVRPTIMGEVGPARERIEALVASADVVKVSDEDLTWLYPEQDPIASARNWAHRGPALVVVTRGGSESVGLCAAGEVRDPSPLVSVVDTVGAGDSYMAALLDALWRADLLGASRRRALHRIGTTGLRAAMTHAAAAAALTVSRAGANPPSRDELEQSLARHGTSTPAPRAEDA